MKVRVTMRMSRRLQTQLQTCYTAVWRCSLVHTARLLKKSLESSAGGINKLKMSLLEHWCIIQFNCPTALVCDGPICRKQVDRGNFKYCSYWMIKINISTSKKLFWATLYFKIGMGLKAPKRCLHQMPLPLIFIRVTTIRCLVLPSDISIYNGILNSKWRKQIERNWLFSET